MRQPGKKKGAGNKKMVLMAKFQKLRWGVHSSTCKLMMLLYCSYVSGSVKLFYFLTIFKIFAHDPLFEFCYSLPSKPDLPSFLDKLIYNAPSRWLSDSVENTNCVMI